MARKGEGMSAEKALHAIFEEIFEMLWCKIQYAQQAIQSSNWTEAEAHASVMLDQLFLFDRFEGQAPDAWKEKFEARRRQIEIIRKVVFGGSAARSMTA